MKFNFKRLLTSVVVAISMAFTSIPAYAATDVELKVVSDKTTVVAGDTVTYTVSIGAVTDLGGIQFCLDVPEGLTYESYELAADINNTLGAYMTSFEDDYFISFEGNYTSAGYTTLMTFTCTVDDNAVGSLEMNLDDIAFGDSTGDVEYGYTTNFGGSVVNVTLASTAVTLDKNELSIKSNATAELTAALSPENSTDDLTWISSDPSVVSVTKNSGNAKKSTLTPAGVGTATITVTTTSGKSATCKITVICAHENTEAEVQKDATCGEDGSTGYWECTDCGEIFSDAACTKPVELEDTVIPATGKHTGGKATCKELAKCTVCDEEYGELADHTPKADDGDCTTAVTCSVCDIVTTAAKASHTGGKATCKELAKCTVCDKEYGEVADHTPKADDGDCTTAVTCSVCNAVTTAAKASHTGGKATCKELAKCTVCNKEYGELAECIADEDDGDCTTDILCSVCKKVLTEGADSHKPNADDGDCTTEITCSVCGTVTTKANANHTGGTATCKELAKCIECGKEYGELAAHTPKEDDGDCTTEVTCSVCSTTTTKAQEHSLKWVQDVAATEEATGLMHQECENDGCNYETSHDTVIPKLDHVHNMVKTAKKDATCTEKGNIEYYTCSKCEKTYNDETGLNVITDMSKTEIAALGHDFTKIESNAEGHWYNCAVCGVKDDSSFAEHTYEGNECTVCKYVQDAVITAGANSIFKINDQSSLTFTSDGNFDNFVEVRVDGTVVDSENYTVTRGSTIVTLKREFIATLSMGTHTLDIVFTNNDIASCSFECVNTYVPSIPSGGNTGGSVTTTTAPVTTPETTPGITEDTAVTTKPADEAEAPEDIDDDTVEDDADISVEPDDTDDDTDDSTDSDVDNETSGETDENPFTGVVISFAGVAVSVAAVVMTKKRKQK